MARWLVVWLLAILTSGPALAQDAPPAEAAPPPAEAAPPPAEAAPPPAEAAPPPAVDIRQVQVQVWISETNEQGLRDIGANLNYYRFVRGEEQSGSLQQLQTRLFVPENKFPGVTLPVPDQNLFPPPIRPDESGTLSDGLQSREGLGLTASIINPGYGTVEATFRALERKSDGDLISKPELLVVNNGVASINAGGEVPYQTVGYTSLNQPQLKVTWEKIGVNMKLQPVILPNDMIQMHIQELNVTEVSRIDNVRGLDLPVFSTRSQQGFILVPNGQTLVIGGLSSRVVRKTERRVPVVGRVPFFGIPFRSRKSEADITHLLIFVSPTVVDLRTLDDGSLNALEFWRERGGEWLNTERIDQEVEAMKNEL